MSTLIVEAGSALHRQALIACAGTTQGVLVRDAQGVVTFDLPLPREGDTVHPGAARWPVRMASGQSDRFVEQGCEVLEAREYVGAARAQAGGAA